MTNRRMVWLTLVLVGTCSTAGAALVPTLVSGPSTASTGYGYGYRISIPEGERLDQAQTAGQSPSGVFVAIHHVPGVLNAAAGAPWLPSIVETEFTSGVHYYDVTFTYAPTNPNATVAGPATFTGLSIRSLYAGTTAGTFNSQDSLDSSGTPATWSGGVAIPIPEPTSTIGVFLLATVALDRRRVCGKAK